MPAFELSLILRSLPRADIAATLKRIGCFLIEKGANVRKLENLGIDRELPLRFYIRDVNHMKGSYFVYSYMGSPKLFNDIKDECSRDVDILKWYVILAYQDMPHECTLHEEMNPPALRKSVQDLFEVSKKNKALTRPYYKYYKKHNFYDPFI